MNIIFSKDKKKEIKEKKSFYSVVVTISAVLAMVRWMDVVALICIYIYSELGLT